MFVLGQTFLALLPLVVSKDDPIPLVDPSLYIARFAQKLDFESSTLAVVRDANRIVQRMNRDWMVTGRRPAGLCAAALFVAARMHGFQRTVRELVLVVKICQGTIRTRLKEFVQTPSAQLTVKDFQTIWLEDGENPPAFQQSSHRESAEVAQKVKDIHQDDINQIENNGTQENICDDLDTLLQDISPLATPSTTRPSSPAHPSTAEDSLLHVPDAHLILNSKLPLSSPEDVLLEESITSTLVANTHTFPQSFHDSQASGGHDEPLGDMDDDDEVHAMVSVDADERAFKEGIWTTSNSDWILKQEQKALIGDIKPARVKRQKKEHGQSGVAVGFGQSASPAQAAREMIKMKPALSKKINYQALDSLFESKPVV